MTEPETERLSTRASGPIQFTTLNKWRRERAMLEVYLVNGQRLVGRVRSFDRFSMLLEMPQGGCFVFHHTVSTLQPAAKGGARRPAPSARPARREREDYPSDARQERPGPDDGARPRSAAPEVKIRVKPRRAIQRDS
ncbi:MAG: RNA chaperone Hfq [Burkholderiaceae bacterium]